jgi:hypothetical protein
MAELRGTKHASFGPSSTGPAGRKPQRKQTLEGPARKQALEGPPPKSSGSKGSSLPRAREDPTGSIGSSTTTWSTRQGTESQDLMGFRRDDGSGRRGSMSGTESQDLMGFRRDDGSGRRDITVTLRVRPALRNEGGSDAITCAPDGKTVCIDSDDGRSKTIKVDEVVDSRRDSEGTQADFYRRVGTKLVVSALKDYNICVFAYGHTGSGKTYTMLGHGGVDGPTAGLLPRVVSEIFKEHIKLNFMSDAQYTVQFYEVYNESIRDLLAPTHVQGQDRKRTVHVHPKHGVRIEGLSTSVVKDAEEALSLVMFGNQMRTVATTTMNAQSSRSHAIFTFRYEHDSDQEYHESVMTFVDLAGREDQAASQNRETQFREMTYINKSLFHLSHVITKLAEGTLQRGSLADFRNSKLTLLLSQALTGNSCTHLIATIAPPTKYFEDSLSTMSFAQQVKRIKTKPMVNDKKSPTMVRELEDECERLRRELQEAKSGNSEMEQELLTAQAMIEHFKDSRGADLEASSSQAAMTRHRVSVMLGLGGVRTAGYAAVPSHSGTGEPLPFLTKLSNDSSLQGCCNYFLNKHTLGIGSAEHGCDIIIQGVGIRPLMCLVKYHTDKRVTIEIPTPGRGTIYEEEERMETSSTSSSDFGTEIFEDQDGNDPPRVLVNGQTLTPEAGTCELHHGDSIILGYAHAYRLVVPYSTDGRMDAQTIARKMLDNMEVSVAMQEVKETQGRELKEIMPVLQRLSGQIELGGVEAMMKAFNAICPMIDEANQITMEIFGEGTIYFKVHVLTDVFALDVAVPQMVVCVISDVQAEQNVLRPDTPALTPRRRTRRGSLLPLTTASISESLGIAEQMTVNAKMDHLLYVWTLEKFMIRLTEMRDLYQGGTDANDGFEGVRRELREDPYRNPWREAVFADVKLLSEKARENLGAEHFNSMQPHLSLQSNSLEPHSPMQSVEGQAEAACASEVLASTSNPSWPASQEQVTDGTPRDDKEMSTAVDAAKKDSSTMQDYLSDGDMIVLRHRLPSDEAFNGLEAFINDSLPSAQPVGTWDDLYSASVNSSISVRKLQAEVAACRRTPGQNPDDLSKLLDRLEGLINDLASSPSLAAQQALCSSQQQYGTSPTVACQYQMSVPRSTLPSMRRACAPPVQIKQSCEAIPLACGTGRVSRAPAVLSAGSDGHLSARARQLVSNPRRGARIPSPSRGFPTATVKTPRVVTMSSTQLTRGAGSAVAFPDCQCTYRLSSEGSRA